MESDLVAGVGAMIPLEPCPCNLEQGIEPDNSSYTHTNCDLLYC